MKKSLKIILIVLGVLILYTIFDLVSIYTKNKPIIVLNSTWFINDMGEEVSKNYSSLFYNVYNCEQYPTPQIKAKWSGYSCPVMKETNFEIKKEAELNELEGVSMTIKDNTLTRIGATIVITDTSEKNNIYGEEYRIDKKENGMWNELDVVVKGNYGFNSIGYYVNENNQLEMNINWQWLYGKLNNGEYRLVKSTSVPLEDTRHYFSVEFIIG